MKKIIFSSLIAVLMLGSCQNEAKKENNQRDSTLQTDLPVADSATTDSAASSQIAVDQDTVIYNYVSLKTPPTYPGGIDKFYKDLFTHLKYPEAALKNKVQGTINATFTVEKDGSLKNIQINKRLGSGTDEEAIRVLQLVQKWNPGMQHGKPVRSQFNLPIKFTIKNK